MAVSTDVSLQSVLGTLTGRHDVIVETDLGNIVTGTLSVVGNDVVIFSPEGNPTQSVVVPFASIVKVFVPGT